LPLVIIGGGELLALAPAINGGLTSIGNAANTAYWNAGAYVNYLNIWGSEMLYQPMVWKIARTAIPILYSPQVRRYGDQVFRYLLKESYRGGFNVQNTTKAVTETFILPPGSHFE